MEELENYCIFIRNGVNIKNSKERTGIPITRIETISNGYIDQSKMGYADIIDDSYKDYYLKKDDILMSHINSMKHLGKVAYCEKDLKVIHGMNLLNIRPDTQKIYPKYLYYYFKSSDFKIKLNKISKQSINQCSFAVNHLKKIKIKTTSIDKQIKITKHLDSVNNLIEIKRMEIKRNNELAKSQFIEMFGNPILNEKKWDKYKLNDKCNIITGNTPSRKIKNYYGNYIEWIKSDNISEDSIYLSIAREYLSEKGLQVGRSIDSNSILMTCIAGSLNSIGNVCITDRRVSFNQQINGIVPNGQNVYFLYEQFVLSKNYLHSPVNMSLKGILSKNQLGNLEFIFPPIELQNKYGEIFKQIDNNRYKLEKQLEKLEELQASLMQLYF